MSRFSPNNWCWVRKVFKLEQLVTEYACLWASLVFMAILYAIMFAVMRGWFIVENGVWYWYKSYTGQAVEETQEETDSKTMAHLLLLYPVSYLISILPLSVARWLFYSGYNVKYQGTLFANTLFSLSGTFNSIVFFLTRPHLVVGSSDSPLPAPAVDVQNQAAYDMDLSTPSSWKLGSPSSRSPIASDYAPPRLEKEYNGQFNPYNEAMPIAEGANSHIHVSPRRMESDSYSHATYLSGERSHRDFRPRPSPATLMEEESYGSLPG